MKQKFVQTLSLFAFLLAGAFASAQAQQIVGFTVHVPFDFIVNNQELPAGKYQVLLRENGKTSQLRISGADKQPRLTVFSIPKDTPTYVTNTRMVFRRYGNRYFLGKIWARGEASGHEIARSKAEKQLRRQVGKDSLSLRQTAPNATEVVSLTAMQ